MNQPHHRALLSTASGTGKTSGIQNHLCPAVDSATQRAEAGRWSWSRRTRLLKLAQTATSRHTDTEIVLLPPKSPNLNAYMERWFRSLKSECLDRMIFFVQRSLERAVREYVKHYHGERNHQGLSNQLIEPDQDVGAVAGKIACRERLGDMLKYYHRRAA